MRERLFLFSRALTEYICFVSLHGQDIFEMEMWKKLKTIGTNCQKVSALIGGTILPLTVSFVKLFALIQMNKGGKFLKKKNKKHCDAASMGESRYYRVI